jgi:hypothetical protein
MSAGAVHSMSHLMVARAFLGVFEASFGAGALVNPHHECWFNAYSINTDRTSYPSSTNATSSPSEHLFSSVWHR